MEVTLPAGDHADLALFAHQVDGVWQVEPAEESAGALTARLHSLSPLKVLKCLIGTPNPSRIRQCMVKAGIEKLLLKTLSKTLAKKVVDFLFPGCGIIDAVIDFGKHKLWVRIYQLSVELVNHQHQAALQDPNRSHPIQIVHPQRNRLDSRRLQPIHVHLQVAQSSPPTIQPRSPLTISTAPTTTPIWATTSHEAEQPAAEFCFARCHGDLEVGAPDRCPP